MPFAPAHIRVLVRIRPLNSSEIIGGYGRSNVLTVENNGSEPINFNGSDDGVNSSNATITVNTDDIQGRRKKTSLESYRNSTGYASDNESVAGSGTFNNGKQFTFDAVHGNRSTQCEVFNSVKGIVDAVASGYNGTIFAYGQTGSGKTHTVFGNSESESEFGLVQRSLRALFNKIALSQAEQATGDFSGVSGKTNDGYTTTTTFKASFFEIFNEKVYDLLSTDSLENDLKVRENPNCVYVEGLKEIAVENTVEAEEILYKGMANRHVSATNMNRTSSRSHAIFVLTVKNVRVSPDGLKKVRTSKFTLVDLAGSERQKSTDAWGARLTEASSINKSLTCLGTVINALVDREAGKERHIPVRDSKLTFLLRDSWGGNSKTCLVATVSPSPNSLSETISTLNFAQRAKLVKNNAVLNEDTCGDITAMKAEITMLRAELKNAEFHKDIDDTKYFNIPDDCREDGDIMRVINCRARRNEEKLNNMEKDLNEENKKVNVLKRKLMQESMVRKMKDRRIQYLQRVNRNVSENEEISILREEIESLKKLIEMPSVDAIEWRVEYSKLKEQMQYIVSEKYEERASDEYDRKRLEGIIERLHKEKTGQQKQLSAMVISNTETHAEIDSILDQVDNQEKEMMRLKEILRDTEQKLSLSDSKIAEVEADKQKIRCKMISLEIEKGKMESELESLKLTAFEYSDEIERKKGEIKQKNTELAELQLNSEEMMNDMQTKIDEQTKRFQEYTERLQTSEADLKNKLASTSKDNAIFIQNITEMKSNSEKQSKEINSLQDIIKALEVEKQTKLKERDGFENHLNNSLSRAQEQIQKLIAEKKSLEFNMEDKKQAIKSLKENLNQQTKSLEEMASRLSNVDTEKKELIKSLQDKVRLIEEDKLTILEDMKKMKSEYTVISSKNLELQQKNETLRENEQELRDLYEKSLLDLNQLNKDRTGGEKMFENLRLALEEEVSQIKNEKEKLKCLLQNTKLDLQNTLHRVKEQNESIVNLEQQIKFLNDETKSTLFSMNQKTDNTVKSYESRIENLENDKKNLDEELSETKHKLTDNENKYRMLETRSEDYKTSLVKAQQQLQELQYNYSNEKDENTAKVKTLKGKIDDLNEEISTLNSTIDLKKDMIEKNDLVIREYESKIILLEDQIKSLQSEHNDSMQKVLSEKAQLDDSSATEERKLRSSLKQVIHENKNLKIALKNLDNEKRDLFKQISTMEKSIKDSKETVSSTFEEFRQNQNKLLSLENKYETEASESKQLLEQLNEKIRSLESEKNAIAVKTDEVRNSSEEYKKRMNSYKDQLTLMKREKGSLKYEIETLRESHDVALSREKKMKDRNEELQVQNEQLKKQVNEYKTIENSYKVSPKQRLKGIKSVLTPIRKTSANSPKLLHQNECSDQFSTLEYQMDNVLNKMSHDSPTIASTCDGNDESFDESLFLPNAGEDPINDKENYVYADKNVIHISEEKIDEKLNVSSTPPKHSAPKKRGVLSVIKSSTKKRKKRKRQKESNASFRGNWMLFDNAKIFSDKK